MMAPPSEEELKESRNTYLNAAKAALPLMNRTLYSNT